MTSVQVAQDALADAESAQSAASSRMEAVKARLPQPAPPPAPQHGSGTVPGDDAGGGAGEDEDDLPGAGAAVVPPLKLHQVSAEAQELTLSPELRRALTDAQAGLEAADNELKAAKAAVAAAGASVAWFGQQLSNVAITAAWSQGPSSSTYAFRLAVLRLLPVQILL